MKRRITAVVGALVAAAAISILAIINHSPAVKTSIQDQAAVYEAVLKPWLDKEQRQQLVDEHLSDAPSKADPEFKECVKGLNFVAASGVQQSKSLVGVPLHVKGIKIVDGSKWAPADPGQAIAKGEDIKLAVREGFSHSLITLSQISFSRDGKDALVKIGMTCGGLCGTGSTTHLAKHSTGWDIVGRCGGWVS